MGALWESKEIILIHRKMVQDCWSPSTVCRNAFKSYMSGEGKNRKRFKSNIAWVTPRVRLNYRKWESRGCISFTKGCQTAIFHQDNLAFFFFFLLPQHWQVLLMGKTKNGSWLCNNGNFILEQPAQKEKGQRVHSSCSNMFSPVEPHPCDQQSSRQLTVGSGERAEREVFMGTSKEQCVKCLQK